MALESYLFGICLAFLIGMLFARILRSGPPIDVYRNEKPALDIRTYLVGTWRAAGVMEDVSGRVVGRFVVTLEAAWSGNEGTLTETWHDAAGANEIRITKLSVDTAGNIIGEGTHTSGELYGKQRGQAMQLVYGLKRDMGAKSAVLSTKDCFYAIDGAHFMRKTQMRKFGIGIALQHSVYYKESV